MTAWHNRNLHYVKKLPDLGEYLKPPLTAAEKRAAGERKALALFAGKMKRKEADGGV